MKKPKPRVSVPKPKYVYFLAEADLVENSDLTEGDTVLTYLDLEDAQRDASERLEAWEESYAGESERYEPHIYRAELIFVRAPVPKTIEWKKP